MAQQGRHPRFFTSPYTRWGIILATTALGAVWLRRREPEPIVRLTTPLPETVPFWYMVTAFPALGMLLADLVHLLAEDGLGKRSLELGGQIGVLTAISSLRLTLRLPVSGHSLLFAYVILRRLFVRVPEQRSARVNLPTASGEDSGGKTLLRQQDPVPIHWGDSQEKANPADFSLPSHPRRKRQARGSGATPRLFPVELELALALYAVTSYVKVVWWADPVTVAVGTAAAAGLAAVSWAANRR
jgi:hypothetical protein